MLPAKVLEVFVQKFFDADRLSAPEQLALLLPKLSITRCCWRTMCPDILKRSLGISLRFGNYRISSIQLSPSVKALA